MKGEIKMKVSTFLQSCENFQYSKEYFDLYKEATELDLHHLYHEVYTESVYTENTEKKENFLKRIWNSIISLLKRFWKWVKSFFTKKDLKENLKKVKEDIKKEREEIKASHPNLSEKEVDQQVKEKTDGLELKFEFSEIQMQFFRAITKVNRKSVDEITFVPTFLEEAYYSENCDFHMEINRKLLQKNSSFDPTKVMSISRIAQGVDPRKNLSDLETVFLRIDDSIPFSFGEEVLDLNTVEDRLNAFEKQIQEGKDKLGEKYQNDINQINTKYKTHFKDSAEMVREFHVRIVHTISFYKEFYMFMNNFLSDLHNSFQKHK